MKRLFNSLSLLLLTILLINPSLVYATRYNCGQIDLYVSQQQKVDLSAALAEAMDKYGAGYPYSWKSSNTSVFRTSMPSRTHCYIYACSSGTAELTYHGEYYRGGSIHDIDCTWTIIVTVKENGGGDNPGSGDGDVTDPIGETWIDNGNYDKSWYKESEKNFKISTPEQLAGLAYLVNKGTNFQDKYISLENDINLEGKRWICIGNQYSNPFKGSFYGNKHVISGLNIAIRDEDFYSGFFGCVDKAKIKDLTLIGVLDSSSPCRACFGGLVGAAFTTEISNVSCNIPIYINNNLKNYEKKFSLGITIGGLAGFVNWGRVSNAKYNGEFILKQRPSTAYYSSMGITVGGLIGTISDVDKIHYSESKCTEIRIESPNWQNEESYTSEPSTPYFRIGGFIGSGSLSNDIRCCKSECDLIEVTNHGFPHGIPTLYAGTLVGYDSSNSYIRTTNCLGVLKSITVKESRVVTSFFANRCDYGTDNFCNSDVKISQPSSGSKFTSFKNATVYKLEEMKTDKFLEELNEYSIKNLDEPIWEKSDNGIPQLIPNAGMEEDEPVIIYEECWQDEGNYVIPKYNSNEKAYIITTPQELAGISHFDKPFTTKTTIKLANDIDMSGKMWHDSSSTFHQNITFDGQGHKITGLNILAGEDDENIGFVREISNSEIRDLTLEGTIVGDNIKKDTNIGGLAGRLYECNVSNVKCNISININNDMDEYFSNFFFNTYVGGICGLAGVGSSFSHVRYEGKIIIKNYPEKVPYGNIHAYIGGIVGYNNKSNIEYAETRIPKIQIDFPKNENDHSYIDSRVDIGSICGYIAKDDGGLSLHYSSGICNKIIINNGDRVYTNFGGLVGDKYSKTNVYVYNCYNITNLISTKGGASGYYYANKCS